MQHKKIIFLAIFIFAFLGFSFSVSAAPIIIDHTNTDLSKIPESAINNAKNNLNIAYGHTSHGSHLITGMNVARSINSSLYAYNTTGAAENGVLAIADAVLGGDVGYYPAWVNNTRSYLGTPNSSGKGSSHPNVNVVIWSWCGQASGRTEQSMNDTYLVPMTQLESEYPGIKFIYMTGHLDGSGTNGNLNQRNEQIRAYCRANNKILYDFADVESFDPSWQLNSTNYMTMGGGVNSDGNGCGYNSGNNSWCAEWKITNPNNPLTTMANSTSCVHSEGLNCVMKGRAAWWLWARVAGWDGNPAGATTYTIGGTITGQTSSVVLQNNGGNNLTVASGASTFTFSTPVNPAGAYAVTVSAQPAGQYCNVRNSSGNASANVSNVVVACCKRGDIDCNGSVAIADIQSAVNVFLGIEINPEKIERANLNPITIGDPVGISDIQKIVNLFLGIGG